MNRRRLTRFEVVTSGLYRDRTADLFVEGLPLPDAERALSAMRATLDRWRVPACRHPNSALGFLCVAHPAGGVKCGKCMGLHRARYRHAGDDPQARASATFDVRFPDGHTGLFNGSLWLVGFDLARDCPTSLLA